MQNELKYINLFRGHNPVEGIIKSIISQAGFFFWLASVNCQVILASNRFFAIYMPFSYQDIYSNNKMIIYIIIFWIITSIAPGIGFIGLFYFYFFF